MIVVVRKGINRAHGMSHSKKQGKMPLTWAMLVGGRQAVVSMKDRYYVMWLGLAVLCFLWCRASKLWVYANGHVHPEFGLTPKCIPFFHEGVQVAFANKSVATAVRVRFRASGSDQERAWYTITRTRLEKETEPGGGVDGSVRSSAGTSWGVSPATSGSAVGG